MDARLDARNTRIAAPVQNHSPQSTSVGIRVRDIWTSQRSLSIRDCRREYGWVGYARSWCPYLFVVAYHQSHAPQKSILGLTVTLKLRSVAAFCISLPFLQYESHTLLLNHFFIRLGFLEVLSILIDFIGILFGYLKNFTDTQKNPVRTFEGRSRFYSLDSWKPINLQLLGSSVIFRVLNSSNSFHW